MDEWTSGWKDGWMDEWTEGCRYGWMGGQTDGRADERTVSQNAVTSHMNEFARLFLESRAERRCADI